MDRGKPTRSFLILVVMVLMACSTTPKDEARERMLDALETVSRLPIQCEYSVTNRTVGRDEPFVMELSGVATYAAGARGRTELSGVVYPESDPTSRGDVRILTVLDGSNTWIEIGSPTAGIISVASAPLDPSHDSRALVSLVEDLVDEYRLVVGETSNGTISIEGTHPEADYPAHVVLDAESSEPLEIRLGPDPGTLHLKFLRWKVLDEVNQDLFVYEPPDGVEVQSITGRPEGEYGLPLPDGSRARPKPVD